MTTTAPEAPVTTAAPDAPAAPADAPPVTPDAPAAAAAPDALDANIPDLATIAHPAPGADPVGAHAFFVGPDGVEAWLDTSGDQPVGYLRDVARPYRAVRIDDPHAWAQVVDHLGLHEDPVPTLPTPAPVQPSEQDAPPADDTAAPATGAAQADPALAGEGKSVGGKFDAAKHPRDKHGRFMHIGDSVDLGGAGHGKITGTTSDGKLTVRKASGGTVKVDPKSVAKVGGGAPNAPGGGGGKPGAPGRGKPGGGPSAPQASPGTPGQGGVHAGAAAAVGGEGDGHTRGTKFDTPVDKYGMAYSADAAANPRVQALKTDKAAWDGVPSEAYPLKGSKLLATEQFLRSKPIDKVTSGREAFREGYDAHILRTDQGDIVIDGHHRVAMYQALGRDTMPAKVIDERASKGGRVGGGAPNAPGDARTPNAPSGGGKPGSGAPSASPAAPGTPGQGGGRTGAAAAAVDAVYAGNGQGGPVGASDSGSGGPHAGLSDADLSKSMQSAAPGPEFDALYEEAAHRADAYASDLLGTLGQIEPGITSSLTGMADKYGGRMEGLDFQLKAQDSLSRKIRDKSLVSGRPMADVSAKIGDALRYTMILDENHYAEGTAAVMRDFEAQGMTVVDQDNSWHPSNVYQGINANFRTKDGHLFEVQFHTQKSFEQKDYQHHDYELARDPKVPYADRMAAWDRMLKQQAQVPVPPNVGSVGIQRVYAPPAAPSPAPATAAAIKSLYDTMEAERKGGGVMATQQPGGGGAKRFYALHLPGDSDPFAIAAKSAVGAPERWVPGQGWVDMPVLADYFTGEDPGAHEITPEQAHTYMESGLGAMGEGAVEKLRGAK